MRLWLCFCFPSVCPCLFVVVCSASEITLISLFLSLSLYPLFVCVLFLLRSFVAAVHNICPRSHTRSFTRFTLKLSLSHSLRLYVFAFYFALNAHRDASFKTAYNANPYIGMCSNSWPHRAITYECMCVRVCVCIVCMCLHSVWL